MRCQTYLLTCAALGVLGLAEESARAQAPAEPKPIHLRVLLPQSDALLTVEGLRTRQTGTTRLFESPPLQPGNDYVYTLEAVWQPNDYTTITRTRRVSVKVGPEITADLRQADQKEPDKIVIRFVPTPPEIVDAMLRLAEVGEKDVVYDLGCGDGRIVIAAVENFHARRGVGIDLDPQRLRESRANARAHGVADRVEFRQEDVLQIKDLANATVVTLYMSEELNRSLRPILQKQLKPGARIVSHRFTMGDWKPLKTDTIVGPTGERFHIHLWKIAEAGAGNDRPDRTPAARAFVAAQARGDFTAATREFDEVMKKASPPDKMEKVWKALEKQAGPFQKQFGTRRETLGKYDLVYVTCQWEKTQLDVRVVFTRDGQITGYTIRPVQKAYDFKPPPYAREDSFREKEVTVGSGEWALPGTLTLPKGEGPFPGVVLVHGSGPHDRDETIGPNKPFRDLAWGLASQGIAVLRYEKRTKQHASRMAALKDTLTYKEEVVDDALAAAALLRTRPEIDRKRVFVLGHSLGALLAPEIGVRDPDLAGLILLAGNSRALEDVILDQVTYVLSLQGAGAADREELEKIKKQVAQVKDRKLGPDTPAADLPLGVPPRYWLALRDYRPLETAQRFPRPMLFLQGERDYQVTMEDFAGWKKALGARSGVTFKSYPRLNHLFMEGAGKARPAEYDKAGHVDREVVDDIARWIKAS
jgi:uncharacterized protein (TIGR03000 family)